MDLSSSDEEEEADLTPPLAPGAVLLREEDKSVLELGSTFDLSRSLGQDAELELLTPFAQTTPKSVLGSSTSASWTPVADAVESGEAKRLLAAATNGAASPSASCSPKALESGEAQRCLAANSRGGAEHTSWTPMADTAQRSEAAQRLLPKAYQGAAVSKNGAEAQASWTPVADAVTSGEAHRLLKLAAVSEESVAVSAALSPKACVTSPARHGGPAWRAARARGAHPLQGAGPRSSVGEVKRVFQAASTKGSETLDLEELRGYLCETLGYGEAETAVFFRTYGTTRGLTVEGLKRGMHTLNPYHLSERLDETLLRRPGSLGGESVKLEDLQGCLVLLCDHVGEAIVDCCSGCRVLVGACAGATCVRDCEDCTIWVASAEFRARNCRRCTFYLHTQQEVVIEESTDLRIAPLSAEYPGHGRHLREASLDPQANRWARVREVGRGARSTWRVQALEDCEALVVQVPSAPPPEPSSLPALHEASWGRLWREARGAGEPEGPGPQLPAARPGAAPRRREVSDLSGCPPFAPWAADQPVARGPAIHQLVADEGLAKKWDEDIADIVVEEDDDFDDGDELPM